jgi:hypothetical protein
VNSPGVIPEHCPANRHLASKRGRPFEDADQVIEVVRKILVHLPKMSSRASISLRS